jgi:hypothetical protein
MELKRDYWPREVLEWLVMGFIVCFGKNLVLLGCFEVVDVDVGMASTSF